MKKFYYFAYGILTNPDIINKKFAIGPAILHGYELEITKYANIVENPNSLVNGVLWELPSRLLSKLDQIEGYPELYIRKQLSVECDGQTYLAEVYIMSDEYKEIFKDKQPNQSYLSDIRKGYNYFHVPKNIMNEVAMTPAIFSKSLSTDINNVLIGFEFEFCVTGTFLQDEFDYWGKSEEIISPTNLYSARLLVGKYLQSAYSNIQILNSYHEKTKKHDRWYLEPDTSLTPEDEYDIGCELVGPPLPLNQALIELEKFYKLAHKANFYTGIDNNTGLHINISTNSEIDLLKFVIFLGDKHLLELFHKKDAFAKSVVKDLSFSTFKTTNIPDLTNMLKYLMRDHDASISFESGKYLSIRHVGGDYLNDFENIKNTLGRVVHALNIACDKNAYRQEYLKKIYLLKHAAENISVEDKAKYLQKNQSFKTYMIDIFYEKKFNYHELQSVCEISNGVIQTNTPISVIQTNMIANSNHSFYNDGDINLKRKLVADMKEGKGHFNRYIMIPSAFSNKKFLDRKNGNYLYVDILDKFLVVLTEISVEPNTPEYNEIKKTFGII